MKGYYINERYVAYDEQQQFTLPKPYVEGGITVYLNGIPVQCGKEEGMYTEVDNYTIKFNEGLSEGSIVLIKSLYHSQHISIDVVSNNNYNPNSIFKKYGTVEKLKLNEKYNMCIKLRGEYVNWSFATRLDPLLTTVRKVRLDTGDILESVPDGKILEVIYMNSKEAISLYEELDDDSIAEETITTTSGYPRILHTWTRYRTVMDLITAVYLTISGKYGTTAKKIGVIDISQTIKLPYIQEMLSRFKQKFEQADDALRPKTNQSQSFTRAGNTSYPVTTDRMSF